ncbi:hypothetical protein DC498_24985 [Terrimonas sp.]|uniref:family 16 glycoside hydrolase n=1 Tax=Terrimonas sp. TaxID=1914338 RepID=UPI000D5251A7|nr:family 16 glycoside hydrolase [Terrimonas sp.]PVD49447.1 hypothetical protein DC498_24985 [Terrimonas sp.]
MKKFLQLFLMLFISITTYSQTLEPDLHNAAKWLLINRNVYQQNENDRKIININETPGNGLVILRNYEFSNGTIEFDVKGKDVLQQSFVGIAFHVIDETHFDAIYFRPFNFKSKEDTRRSHSVQYISMPDYDWEKLRTQFPGKYENYVSPEPDPNDWFHAKVVVKSSHVAVYVNDTPDPVLESDKLNNNTNGKIALWVGNNSGGSFANLKITPETNSGNTGK